ncbi:phosphotransferase enzyme family protein [Streptomyces sp. NPDC059991]|uniref:phosphotransferase enzyme family protein n=1 Tax=Streptomyces sp. NPDC059991 TaxID=3347028 RepID=UPI00367914D2
MADRDDPGWDQERVEQLLRTCYGMEAAEVELVPEGTDTVNWRVLTSTGRRLFVKEYDPAGDPMAARAALDMSEYCRAAGLPVPRVHANQAGDLLTLFDDSPWSVINEVVGRVATTPMTASRAEHIGSQLGRMHRALSAYPLPQRHQHSRWRTGTVEDGLARCDRVMASARRHGHPYLDRLRDQLDQRRHDLRSHVARLRAGLPGTLVTQALHADFVRPNILLVTDLVTGIIDFRCAQGSAAWELGRAALDPRTIAHSDDWISTAAAMVAAYLSEHPHLPRADIVACGRITLLYLLFSFYGAVPTEEHLAHQALEDDLARHWEERQTSIRRLLDNMDELEATLQDTLDRSGSGR